MADEYLAECQDTENDEVESTNEQTGRTRYQKKLRVKMPTIEGFSLYLGVTKSSLYEWEEKHPEFSYALGKIRTEQHNRLVEKGLSGDYNSTITKLMLSNNHGYSEKTEQDITSKGESLGVVMLPHKNESSLETTGKTGDSSSEE